MRIRRTSSGFSRLDQISLIDSRDGCNGADDCRTVSQIDPRQRQREEEQQRSGDFIDDGMHSRKLFLFEIPHGDVEQLDDRDDGDPDIKPGRNLQHGQQLYEADRREDEIRDRIQSGAQLAHGAGFPCHGAVDHIGEAGGEIERIERRRQRRAEQQRGAEHNSNAGNDICHLTPGFPLRSDCRPDHRSE